jgi:hypothetical protein
MTVSIWSSRPNHIGRRTSRSLVSSVRDLVPH